jgi:alginate O-acetyltransferase complex protein AlgI
MLFTSFAFIGLVLITCIIYYFPKLHQHQVATLIMSSLVFYSFNQPKLAALLILSICINAATSYRVKFGAPVRSKVYAITGVSLNLLILALFKYSPLFGKTLFSPHNSVGQFLLAIPLPVGISFFTFRGISLVVDVFRMRKPDGPSLPIHKSFIGHLRDTFFYVSFFPQLLAGPIVKARCLLPQINRKYFKDIDWEYTFKKLALGFFLKMVIADNLKGQTFWIAYPYFQGLSSLCLITVLFGYSFEIFSDFAGYSLIALGITGLFGYRVEENFNFPYIAASFSELWGRWHISLSSFLKEYLYIPLGGNRKGKMRTYVNLMITMFLGGLWHGAAWSYVVWGTFHGAALVIERFARAVLRLPANAFVTGLRMMLVFMFVTFAWLLFKLPEFAHVIEYIKAIGNNTHTATNYKIIFFTFIYSLPVVLYHGIYMLYKYGNTAIKKYEPLFYGIILFMILTNSGSPGSFIYFQF